MAAPVETPRLQQLRKLASSVPGQNQRVATGLQEAQKTALQAQLGAAPAGVGGVKTAQQAGAQVAGQAAQTQLQTQAQTQKDLGQVAQIGLAQLGQESAQRIGQQERGLSQSARRLENQLAKLSQDAKNQLVDKQNQFRVDSAGQQLLNERQLADWAALKARNEEELKAYSQIADQTAEREVQYYQTMHKKVMDTLKSGYDAKGQRLDTKSRAEFKWYANWLKEQEQKKLAKRAMSTQVYGAAGGLIGGLVGGYFGGPVGAAAGSTVGTGLGTVYGQEQAKG